MKVVIIGGLAAGPKTASRIRRLCDKAEVTVIEKEEFFSYSNCALPYYISGIIKEQKELMTTPTGTVRDINFFKNVKDVNIINNTETTGIDSKNKKVFIRDNKGEEKELDYDKLVFATGVELSVPSISGIKLENIFTLKNIQDANAIKKLLSRQKGLNAVVIGSGIMAIEVAEALHKMECHTTIIESKPNILPMMDTEMAILAEKHLQATGIHIQTASEIVEFTGDKKVRNIITDKGKIPADIVIFAEEPKPSTELAIKAELKIGTTGAIAVNEQMQTSNSNIYAVGDCAEKTNLITGEPYYIPFSSANNREGRVAANVICGLNDTFSGILGTTISKVFNYSIGRTGLSEKEAKDMGYDVVVALSPAPDIFHSIPTAKPIFIKLIAERKSRKLLGMQAVGLGDIARRIDVVAMALTSGMTVDQVANLDISHSPLFSQPMDNIITATNILRNKIDGYTDGISPAEVMTMLENGESFTLLDVRSPAEFEEIRIEGVVHIPIGTLRKRVSEIDHNKPIIPFCKISLRGYEAALILKEAGFNNVKVMDGGILMWHGELILN